MAVASAADLTLLRSSAGRIAEVTDKLISGRVFSYRIVPRSDPDAAWTFRPRGWMSFVGEGVTLLEQADSQFMCRTDVTKFYESIRIETLEQMLYARNCDRVSVKRIVSALRFWRELHGRDGLPIGPEGCAVLGNFFLEPVDRSIISTGIAHRRYGDDFLIFTPNRRFSEALVDLFDDELSGLNLSRSEEKTIYFDDPEDATANLKDGEIDYLDGGFAYSPGLKRSAVRRAFDRLVSDSDAIKQSRFRWILRFLMNKGDEYGCSRLSERQDLMNIDPKLTSEYLKTAGSDERVVENCMRRLSQTPESHLEALALHELRTMSKVRTGTAEANEFKRIASDRTRPWPTRCSAWKALARSDETKPRYLMEAAREEKEPNVRRAIVASLKRFSGDGRVKTFLQLAAKEFPESRYAVDWLKAAA
ncbi:MAG: reverse transcriptase domain-containing protein [Candidatus Binatus sp.]|uniref:RNA-directed DNA polymerase n=1 Tax=Candidatus Binatus sp. TaxID=2811406 RepID=UPI0027239C13|nr:reverse transcriptase domain-containing protein [Candidatus Binatus sp.]MDO8433880.1 reverse transcriptase domain-containing protein [Candidatus Binatus sp.]